MMKSGDGTKGRIGNIGNDNILTNFLDVSANFEFLMPL